MLIYTHCWELMNSVGSHGSSSLSFVMKVMVCHFVSDSHEVMTALIVELPLIVVVEISLQRHQDFGNVVSENLKVRSCFLIAMQLLAYHLTVLRGFNVDQPRNLAKSVTIS
jgi:glucosamine 6-phosphate synthetase-like amidotransferase/phosphosugar isomerase protein